MGRPATGCVCGAEQRSRGPSSLLAGPVPAPATAKPWATQDRDHFDWLRPHEPAGEIEIVNHQIEHDGDRDGDGPAAGGDGDDDGDPETGTEPDEGQGHQARHDDHGSRGRVEGVQRGTRPQQRPEQRVARSGRRHRLLDACTATDEQAERIDTVVTEHPEFTEGVGDDLGLGPPGRAHLDGRTRLDLEVGGEPEVLDDADVEVEIADGVKVRVVKSTVSHVVSKTEPAAGTN